MNDVNINIAICGHIEHGKSTLLGRILIETNQVDEKIINESEKFLLNNPKLTKSNKYSIILARSLEERFLGLTKEIAHIRLKTDTAKQITLIDTPGHPDFKRMRAYGIFSSETAILVVSAVEGEQSSTIEALKILKSYNIPLCGVVISKTDLVDNIEKSIEKIKKSIDNRIDELGVMLLHEDIPYFPLSALKDKNIDPFINFLKSVEFDDTNKRQKLRFCVQGKMEVFGIKGIGAVAKGLLDSGTIKINDKLLFQPASYIFGKDIIGTVKGLQPSRAQGELKSKDIEIASARDFISVAFRDINYEKLNIYLDRGGILINPEDKISVTTIIEAEITIVNRPFGAYAGWEPYLRFHVMGTSGRIVEIYEIRDIISDWAPATKTFIRDGEQAKVKIQLKNPSPFEEYNVNPRLARFSMYDSNLMCGIGICKKIC